MCEHGLWAEVSAEAPQVPALAKHFLAEYSCPFSLRLYIGAVKLSHCVKVDLFTIGNILWL
jgi:hypothetical protein